MIAFPNYGFSYLISNSHCFTFRVCESIFSVQNFSLYVNDKANVCVTDSSRHQVAYANLFPLRYMSRKHTRYRWPLLQNFNIRTWLRSKWTVKPLNEYQLSNDTRWKKKRMGNRNVFVIQTDNSLAFSRKLEAGFLTTFCPSHVSHVTL